MRDMELRGQNHNCRLWISFDSPHLGAYVPLGIQYSLNELASSSKDAERLRDLSVNSAAAQQMILHHYKSNSISIAGVSNFFYPYYNEINGASFGFPQALGLRKIAMINGSDLGVDQTFGTACQLATQLEVNYKPRGFTGFLLSGTITIGAALLSALSPLQVQSTYLAPNSGQCTIFNFHNSIGPDYTKLAVAPSWNSTSFDLVQGGFVPLFYEYKKDTDGKRPKKWYKNLFQTTSSVYVASGSHELTYSTMAMGLGSMPNPLRKWDDNFRIDANGLPIDVTCPETKESPFDMYWAPDINTRHDSLLYGHVIRMRSEINGVPWPRTLMPRYSYITSCPGSICFEPYLCPGDSRTFSINDPQIGMIYNWTVSDPSVLNISSGQGTSSIVVQNVDNGNSSGYYSISCSAQSTCYNLIVPEFSIWTGKPTFTGTYNSPTSSTQPLIGGPVPKFLPFNQACYEQITTATMTINPNISPNIVWELDSGTPGISWWEENNNLKFTFFDLGDYAVFKATAHTPCGITTNYYKFTSVNGNCTYLMRQQNSETTLSVTPNPTNNKINIRLKSSDASVQAVRILDYMGHSKFISQTKAGLRSIELDLSSYAAGIYLIMVYDGKKWTTEKVVKK
jgi:Secretion system C-terminal sorting domain